jgi:hypothetical protein
MFKEIVFKLSLHQIYVLFLQNGLARGGQAPPFEPKVLLRNNGHAKGQF